MWLNVSRAEVSQQILLSVLDDRCTSIYKLRLVVELVESCLVEHQTFQYSGIQKCSLGRVSSGKRCSSASEGPFRGKEL